MRARFVDERDPDSLAPCKRVAQARGKFQSRSTTTDDNDFVKWHVFLGCLVRSHARIVIVRCGLKHFGHSQSGTYSERTCSRWARDRSRKALINQATGQIEQYNARVENIGGIGIIEPISQANELVSHPL